MDSNTLYDVIIVGGGIMGSTTAYYLTQKDPQLNVAVIERDLTYARASTTLSMVNARIQYTLKQNVQISQFAFDVLEHFEDRMTVNDIRPSIGYHREGNLFLYEDGDVASAKAALAMQQALGCQVTWWSPEEIKAHYPLYAPEALGLVGGTFGAQDGHFDAYAVLMGYKANARAQGAVYIEDDVTALVIDNHRIGGVKTKSGATYSSAVVINCAGAWCTELARTAGVELPVNPVKRQCFCVDPAVKSDRPLPLTILPSGFYFRTETGGMVLMGKSLPEDVIGFDFTWDQNRFMDHLWPELAEFVPAFEQLKLIRGWAGLYAVNTLDGNAILGEWPEIKGFYLANGFSGHGLQQGPAVGRYMSELITGATPTLDLSIFHPQRILDGKPIAEGGLLTKEVQYNVR
ncbi:FAD dependent oxidoreductase [Desulfosarcina cetonica]|uniref:NAD(P)/FAD-dependent oxidoreductase n=1 Tax=Desulfosarcina cetonica TaxID=90730 RepID=UPI0012ECD61B|nr:FAD-binding oxidoreductase [Desulfosarcina cetonica]VTR69897.1 FAD dependent oxidoreductase [Desulfosarcina cetonica]